MGGGGPTYTNTPIYTHTVYSVYSVCVCVARARVGIKAGDPGEPICCHAAPSCCLSVHPGAHRHTPTSPHTGPLKPTGHLTRGTKVAAQSQCGVMTNEGSVVSIDAKAWCWMEP